MDEALRELEKFRAIGEKFLKWANDTMSDDYETFANENVYIDTDVSGINSLWDELKGQQEELDYHIVGTETIDRILDQTIEGFISLAGHVEANMSSIENLVSEKMNCDEDDYECEEEWDEAIYSDTELVWSSVFSNGTQGTNGRTLEDLLSDFDTDVAEWEETHTELGDLG